MRNEISLCGHDALGNEVKRFQNDVTRKRMDAIMAYYWIKQGRKSKIFNKWRIKYLDYVKTNYRRIWDNRLIYSGELK